MFRLLKTICLLVMPVLLLAQHPNTFFTKAEAAKVKNGLANYPLLRQSFNDIKSDVDKWIGKNVDVPFPKDPAGGYTHDKHKANYMLMFNSGLLYNITQQEKYASLVKDMLLKYAALNPTLSKHPEATSSSPGRIFWQALNDANWMVYAGMAYDLVYSTLSPAERNTIETGAFKPEVDYFTNDLKDWFNLMHNHAVWACAGVGIIGIASNNIDYVDMALYGSNKDGKAGFIAQLDNLFSPDGFYTEGPYYTRYAILPFALFANAINNYRPSLKIFQHRDSILNKALLTCLQLTNLDGTFYPLNDAIKDKNYTTNELVTAINIFWKIYGKNKDLLAVANKQQKVLLNEGGLEIAAALANNKNSTPHFSYKSFESKDGKNGDEGGLTVLRNGKGADLTSLIFKYTSHGLSHGHYDKLNINLYDKGNEILTDYGAVRYVGVEQKYGGRYLPENKSYASQTVAHNTVVLNESSHFNGKESVAEKFHSNKLFSNLSNPAVQVVAATEDNAYKNTHLQRTVYLIQLPAGRKMMADIFNVRSGTEQQYDLPFHYNGNFIHSSFNYESNSNKLMPLGKSNGYQHLWKRATSVLADTTAQFTFLNGNTFYTFSTLIGDSAQILFAETGANDPNFNMRHSPAIIIRKKAQQASFVSVLEIHGNYDPVAEFSSNAYPTVTNIRSIENSEAYTVVEIQVADKKLIIAQSNSDSKNSSQHHAGGISWAGPFIVLFDGKNL